MEALRVEGLTKDFGGVQAVSNVSFSVDVGERLAIIGPNGAGKTTLFNLINGQIAPTAGRIYFFGQDITRLPTHSRAHVGQGRSFQITSLFLNLTVIDNAMITLHGMRPSRFQMFRPTYAYTDLVARAREVLASINLWDQRHELVKNLAYGEQRRLEIALTLALEPKLLLLDEPSCGLTSGESAEITEALNRLGRTITVLLVAHDLDLVFGVADRILVLHYGQMIADGKAEDVRVDPRVKEIYLGLEQNAGNTAIV
ncbi:MAG: ABC transporter ATP-binding protein [Chloroflexota bacterium]